METKSVTGQELFDHEKDPDENNNIAGLTSNIDLVNLLSEQLDNGWKAAMPE